jgi:alkylation response protein AidB-like acyl-CoA dehydrogenase
MDLSPAQRGRVHAATEFARSRLSPGARRREAAGAFDRRLWVEAAAFGLAGLPIPEAFGGTGLDAYDTMLVVEALGRGCEDGGLVFSLCAHMFAGAVAIWRSGAAHIHEKYLREVAEGRLICAGAATEPGAGSDVHAMKASARRAGSDYVLDGAKCFVTNAPVADLLLVCAVTGPGRGLLGLSAFLLPRGAPGLRVAPKGEKAGLRTSPWGTVYLEECRVPESARLGPEGSGAALFRESMNWERSCLFAYYVGAMERSLERCVEHARSRLDAVQLFGGAGVATDTGVDALLRDAVPASVFSGTSEVQRAVIARMLGLP